VEFVNDALLDDMIVDEDTPVPGMLLVGALK
jgi:hypothetical protein